MSIMSLGYLLPAIPQSTIEEYLTHELKLSSALVTFALSLVGSVLSGLLVRSMHGATARHAFSCGTGVLLLYFNLGGHIIHSLLVSLAVYALMSIAPKQCGLPVWVLTFSYLTALHLTRLGDNNFAPAAQNFITGSQMVLTLKLVSTAMCVQDGHSRKPSEMNAYQISHSLQQVPSLLAFFSYVYCLGSLIVGPVVEFRDVQLWARQEGPWDPAVTRKARRGDFAVARRSLLTAVVSLLFFLYMDKRWSPRLLLTGWYTAQPLLYKLLIMQVVGVTFRTRYYFIWAISRAAMAFAGLDLVKWDEEKQQGSWGRACNAYPLAVELADSGRVMSSHWNITTAAFMRRYVYERMVQPGRQPGSAAMLATILVSSFWHGLNIGYFMFFVGWFAFAKHSTVLYKCERAYMPSWAAKSWWWWVIKLVITQQCSVFLLQSFALLTWRDSIAAWASVYYSPLLYIVSVLALGMVVPVKRGAHSSGRSEGVGAKKHDGQSSSIGTIHAKPCVHGHVKDL